MTIDTNCGDLKNPRWVFHPEQDPHYQHFVHIGTAFDPAATTVTRVNACWLADAALLAYWDPEQARARCQRVDLQCEPFSAGGTDGYVIASVPTKWAIVAFRGTQPDQFEDIAADVDFTQVDFEGGKVHRGYSNALNRVAGTVASRISILVADGFAIWMCGHSLGAALATLAAMRFRASIAGICTLGSPRVGDAAFVAAFDEHFGARSARYVNDHDIVARVPPPTVGLFGQGIHYAHVKNPRLIADDGAISAGDDEPSFFGAVFGDPRLIRPMFAMFRPTPAHSADAPAGTDSISIPIVPESILDHMPKAYACAIRAHLDRE